MVIFVGADDMDGGWWMGMGVDDRGRGGGCGIFLKKIVGSFRNWGRGYYTLYQL